MDGITTSRLTIEIGASSDKAVREVNKFSDALKNARQQANQRFQNPLKSFDAKGFDAAKLSSKLHSVDAQIAKTTKAIETLQAAAGKVSPNFVGPQLPGASEQYSQLTAQIRDYQNLLQSLGTQKAQLQSIIPNGETEKVKGLAGLLQSLREKVKLRIDAKDADKASKKVIALGNILSSIKRIAFYRVIRSAIKAVGEAFSQGAENAYWYSKTIGDQTKYIAEAYDRLSSDGFKMSNQLGAAWATLKATITPILLEIVRLVTMAANALTQFFAALGGKGKYLKAIDYSKEWADTTAKGGKAAKEWKNQLLGFDEINRLEEPSSGGGGGGSALPDYENMFEENPISAWAEKVKEHLEAIKTLAKDIGLAILGWNAAHFLGQIPGIGSALKTILGLAMAVYGTFEFIKGYLDAWNSGITFENLAQQVGGATIAIVGLGIAFGVTGAAIGALIFGAAMIIEALHDLAINGSLTNQSFLTLAIGIMAVGVAIRLLTGSWIVPLIATIATVSITIHHFWDEISGWLSGLADKLRESGHDALAGFVEGFVEWGNKAHEWVDEHIVTPFVTALKNLFGIHSPSTVMAGIGENIMQGMWDGIEEIWNKLKTWWDNLSLGQIHIPIPVLNWGTRPAGGLVADILGFFGLPSVLPTLSVSWMARGGVVDGATLIGAGEAGKEAIIPLERNTEWISKVAAEMNAQQSNQNGNNNVEAIRQGVFEAVMAAFSAQGDREPSPVNVRVFLDSREIKAGQERLARAWG